MSIRKIGSRQKVKLSGAVEALGAAEASSSSEFSYSRLAVQHPAVHEPLPIILPWSWAREKCIAPVLYANRLVLAVSNPAANRNQPYCNCVCLCMHMTAAASLYILFFAFFILYLYRVLTVCVHNNVQAILISILSVLTIIIWCRCTV